MDHYTLYLDESETFTDHAHKFFAVGGVIVPSTKDVSIAKEMDTLKKRLWPKDTLAGSYILHEKEISNAQRNQVKNAPHLRIFNRRDNVNLLYKGLSQIITNNDIITIGVSIDESAICSFYGAKANSNLTIALQLLLENYCHFLYGRGAIGDICYESLEEPGNQELRQRFHELEALGTMYYPSSLLQTHIRNIQFNAKSENLAGLQLADFVPNTLARSVAGKSPKHKVFKSVIFKHLYDGGMRMRSKYGGKIVP